MKITKTETIKRVTLIELTDDDAVSIILNHLATEHGVTREEIDLASDAKLDCVVRITELVE